MKEKNSTNKNFLKTIWDILDFENPIGPFIPFNREYKNYFRTYEINELHKRSYFLQFQRIKLTYNIIIDLINITNLLYLGLVSDFYPLHDEYILFGKRKQDLFNKIFVKDKENIETNNNMDKEEKDKINNKKLDKINTKKELNQILVKFFNKVEDEADYIDFEEICLSEETKFNWKNPMQLPIPPLRNYFGEKIGLYFSFVKHLSWSNFYMIFFSIIFFFIFFFLKN